MNVDKPDLRASLGDRFCCSYKCVRNSDQDVSLFHTCRHKCKSQRVGSAIHSDAVFHTAKGRKLTFKIFNHRSANKPSIAESLFDHCQEFRLELLMRGNKIQERYFHRVSHAAFSPRSQISETWRDSPPRLRSRVHPL